MNHIVFAKRTNDNFVQMKFVASEENKLEAKRLELDLSRNLEDHLLITPSLVMRTDMFFVHYRRDDVWYLVVGD